MNNLKGDQSRWEDLYRSQAAEEMPWYYPRLDPDFEAALKEMGIHSGTVLDLCTGPGTQALALAERGFSVTATDIADTAVKTACEKARDRGLDINFKQNDLFDSSLDTTFEYIVDRGCYHVFPYEMRKEYPARVAKMLAPRGYLFLKCFSHLEKGEQGPFRIAPDEIQDVFSDLFEVISIKDTVFPSHFTGRRYEPKALFCVMRKK